MRSQKKFAHCLQNPAMKFLLVEILHQETVYIHGGFCKCPLQVTLKLPLQEKLHFLPEKYMLAG